MTHLVTGSNRGIGFALTKELLSRGKKVFAACRNPDTAENLKELQQKHQELLKILPLDVASEASAHAAFSMATHEGGMDRLDVLWNVAGISPPPHDASLEYLEFEALREAFEVNVIGCLRVARTFFPLLRKSERPRVLNFTSGLSSLTHKKDAHFYAYGISKTALNMATRTLANEWKPLGIVCVAVDPGWIKTDMGGPNAPLKPEDAARVLCDTAERLSMEQTGLFLYQDGKQLDW